MNAARRGRSEEPVRPATVTGSAETIAVADDVRRGFDKCMFHDIVTEVGEGYELVAEEYVAPPRLERLEKHSDTGHNGSDVTHAGPAKLQAATGKGREQVEVLGGHPLIGRPEIGLRLRHRLAEGWVLEDGVVTADQGRDKAHGVPGFGGQQSLRGGRRCGIGDGFQGGEEFDAWWSVICSRRDRGSEVAVGGPGDMEARISSSMRLSIRSSGPSRGASSRASESARTRVACCRGSLARMSSKPVAVAGRDRAQMMLGRGSGVSGHERRARKQQGGGGDLGAARVDVDSPQ